jgi:hypothetical protein
MSKSTSGFVAKIAFSLVSLCVVLSVPESGAATTSDEVVPTTPPTTTTTVSTEGNPWHG